MEDTIIVKKGHWYNSNVIKRVVLITRETTNVTTHTFDVWFQAANNQIDIYGGSYRSEHEAALMVEKITGQNIVWHNAV